MNVRKFLNQKTTYKTKFGDVRLNRIEKDLRMVDKLVFVNPLSLSEYENYFENSLKAKSKIRELMNGQDKIVFEVDNDILGEEKERAFREEFRNRLKEKYKVSKVFFVILSIMADSNLISNKHKTGMKFTKKLKEVLSKEGFEEVANEIILMYSQIKNSFIMPKSYFVISIDPTDFVLMGIGKGWKTCYNPIDGDHFTGAFSAGLDSSTILTYFTTDLEDPENKLYRRLGVFTSDYKGMMLSTQYPYKNSSFEEFTISALKDTIFDKDNFVAKRDKTIRVHKNLSSQIFNDFVSSPSNRKENLYIGSPREKEILHYGANVSCLRCGSKPALQDIPVCSDCEYEVVGDNWEEFIT